MPCEARIGFAGFFCNPVVATSSVKPYRFLLRNSQLVKPPRRDHACYAQDNPDRSHQPLNSLTIRLNFSGFSMNMKCAPPSFSSKISVFAPLICFPIQT